MKQTAVAWLAALLLGCGAAEDPLGASEDAGAAEASADDATGDVASNDGPAGDGSPADAAVDAAPFPVRRLPCVDRTKLAGDLPNDGYGALEAELVSLVPPGTKSCPADPDHLHLQVLVDARRYDVAITIDSDTAAPLAILVKSRPPSLPGVGWANDTFDYERELATASADFKPLDKAALLARLTTELSKVSRLRVFGRGYTDGTGTHFVHRNGKDRDGALILRRVEPGGGDRVIALRFANQVF